MYESGQVVVVCYCEPLLDLIKVWQKTKYTSPVFCIWHAACTLTTRLHVLSSLVLVLCTQHHNNFPIIHEHDYD